MYLLLVQINLVLKFLVGFAGRQRDDFRFHIVNLLFKSFDEIFKPASQIGIAPFVVVFTQMNRLVILGALAVVIILHREKTPKIIPALVQNKRRHGARRPAVAVYERMNG